jgi:ubiquinone/menaquinone biosynthesis C-methylase UbiE
MSKLSDQAYLLTEQYKDASKLNARMQLHERFSTNKYGWHRWVFDQLDLPPKCCLLELGCGPGYLWLKNLDRIPSDWDITLSDFSPGMLQEAQQHLSVSRHPFTFGVIDAQVIPFADESVDGVIANHMLYHVPDRDKALSEIRRVLRPAGCLYAATNGRNSMQEFGKMVRRFFPNTYEPGPGSFTLENGLDQLSRWFSEVILHRYEDALVVTEVDALVSYVLSSSRVEPALRAQQEGGKTSVEDRIAEFIRFVEAEITLHGAIHITKDAGVFKAYRI